MSAIPPYRRNNWQPRHGATIHLAPALKTSIKIDGELVEIVPPGAACLTMADTVANSPRGVQRLPNEARERGQRAAFGA
jgi:hypothetical protein